jgi:hypothetical protein
VSLQVGEFPVNPKFIEKVQELASEVVRLHGQAGGGPPETEREKSLREREKRQKRERVRARAYVFVCARKSVRTA